MIMYKLQYFKSGVSFEYSGTLLCGSDLEKQNQTEYINLKQVSSISDMKKFFLPLSGDYRGEYAVVSMQNGDRFYINKTEHSKIVDKLDKR